VYDMYPWDEGSASADAAVPGPAVSAVQVALDRRDNGGETAAAPGTPTALPARQ
jgi:hypothetical protein